VPKTLDYPTVNYNSRQSALHDHKTRPSQTDKQTDRQTDEHHGNSATIRSSS